eukprot:TRINITY_DN23495_c0_g3_i7.p1 TRINITY_DN23495_c0_g3~~TRINITY_DN23495_c0_g3_i7.p1  ORF type:complete len:304 (-),score=66.57 TRINITY_DN23495_c0_g3_i7:640-1551(-)
MFAALFSKLGVRIKTTVPATILEEALNGSVTLRQLALGQPIHRKVEKQCAHFYSVTLTKSAAQAGLVVRVVSSDKSKFKLLYFEREENGGLSLALQEESSRTGRVTSAGMYFLGFQVYHLDSSTNAAAISRDPDTAFFKRLAGFQPCEISELKAGTHVFAVYGDNFFKSASYSLEAVCAEPFVEEKVKLKEIEAQILEKRAELSKFEAEYKEVLAQFTEVTTRCSQEMQVVEELLKQRESIHASYTSVQTLKRTHSSGKINGSRKEFKGEAGIHGKESKQVSKDRIKKKWFNIHLKVDKRKAC